jgi:hypothetical protein
MLQILIVALLVAFCAFYAVWTLMPAAARKWVASVLLERPLPAFVAERLRGYTSAASGCGCDGCDRSVKSSTATSGATPITFHRRRQR